MFIRVRHIDVGGQFMAGIIYTSPCPVSPGLLGEEDSREHRKWRAQEMVEEDLNTIYPQPGDQRKDGPTVLTESN